MFTIINIIECFSGVVYEAIRKLHHRQQVIRFCRSVLSGQNEWICRIIDEHDFSLLDLAVGVKLTRDTFGVSFRRVCEELFRMRPVRDAYIIAIFGYALKLNEYHLLHCRDWYETDLLTYSLVDVLVAYGF